MILRAPFPYFGGKAKVAADVWSRFGDVPNYCEPFCGSAAVLLNRPNMDPGGCYRETINDLNGHVANFWRAVKAEPDEVARHADYIVSEIDLHARGNWLFCRPESVEFVERMRVDHEYYCAKTAGMWCWFASNWIGALPAVTKNAHRTATAVYKRLPHLGDAGNGISRQLPHLGDAGKGISRQLPHLGDAGNGECARRLRVATEWMRTLSDRLRNVRVPCGTWDRILGPSVTVVNAAPCGVFLDPPYLFSAGRAPNLYSEDSSDVANSVREWAIEAGKDERFRIALCGYEGEHEMPSDWECLSWKAHGGYAHTGNTGNENRHRERIWFSPHCIQPARQRNLFSELEEL